MYQFIIPNKKQQIYFVFAVGIILLNIIGAAVYNFTIGAGATNAWVFAVACIVIFSIVLYFFSAPRRYRFAGTLILVFGIFWMSRTFYQLFFVNLLLWGLYTVARRNLVVTVSEKHISYPSFPVKMIQWNMINNVVLKDDILTIDLKNNKIYQHLIEYLHGETDEAEFNDFCRKQLQYSHSQGS